METNLRTDKLLDQIGWKLLQELQINGRLSYAELGGALASPHQPWWSA